VAIELPGGCRVFSLTEGEPATRPGGKIWRHVGRERGARAISLSALELSPRASISWRNAECDDVLFVVSGEGEISLDGAAHGIRPDDGIYVRPRQRVRLHCSDRQPLTVLDSRCPDSGPDSLFDDAAADGPGAAGRALSGIVRFEDQPIERAGDGRWFRVLVDEKAGALEVTQFVGFIPPSRAPEHFHEYEEVACILDGHGRFWSGGASAPIGPGSCLFLPRRQPHCVENTGESPIRLYGLFYPAGSPAVRYHPGGVQPSPSGTESSS
jgi:mannose-6-phosphate isomerase-like protein (cupin superfamily)